MFRGYGRGINHTRESMCPKLLRKTRCFTVLSYQSFICAAMFVKKLHVYVALLLPMTFLGVFWPRPDVVSDITICRESGLQYVDSNSSAYSNCRILGMFHK